VQQQVGPGPAIIDDQPVNPQQTRLQQLTQPAALVCDNAPTDAQLAALFREKIAAGHTPAIAPPPPLPRADGAALARELNTPRPALSANYQRAMTAETAPATGFVMPRVIEAIAHRTGQSLTHTQTTLAELAIHAGAELLSHSLHTVALPLVLEGLLADFVIGSVLTTAEHLNDGTLPPSHAVQQLLQREGPQLIARAQAQIEQRLEQQFHSGAQMAAEGQPLSPNATAAFRRGYSAGVTYRQAHGCEYERYTQARRVLEAVTRGTNRDAQMGVTPLSTAQATIPGVVSREALNRLVTGS
jgi:hypothetical protein